MKHTRGARPRASCLVKAQQQANRTHVRGKASCLAPCESTAAGKQNTREEQGLVPHALCLMKVQQANKTRVKGKASCLVKAEQANETHVRNKALCLAPCESTAAGKRNMREGAGLVPRETTAGKQNTRVGQGLAPRALCLVKAQQQANETHARGKASRLVPCESTAAGKRNTREGQGLEHCESRAAGKQNTREEQGLVPHAFCLVKAQQQANKTHVRSWTATTPCLFCLPLKVPANALALQRREAGFRFASF
eukprot:1156944-Pelagomonas_calceolata.AAC.2